jgi:putative spermidine/putrescine transport system permease protein
MASSPRPLGTALLQLAPFLIFALMFLLLPTSFLFVGAFQDANGHATLANLAGLFSPSTLDAFRVSVEISGLSAILGAASGVALAFAVRDDRLPRWLRPSLLTLSGVASNFAGVPLAFAFLATLGRAGLATALLSQFLGIDLYRTGFSVLSILGLTLTYMYFQVPLMVLVVMPAIDGLKKEWGEASAMLGASPLQHAMMIVVPILAPSVIGASLLLFANAFGAVATAYALTGSSVNLVTILLYAQIRGDVLHDPNLGYALAFGMVFITALCNLLYLRLRAMTERRLS